MSEATADRHTDGRWTAGYAATVALAAVLAVFGLLILGGGIWLITLGGSWYYAVAGAGLCATAWLLVQRSMAAFWVYLATFAFTVAWALWEKGLDGWAQVPRLVAASVLATITCAFGPGAHLAPLSSSAALQGEAA